MTKKDEVKYYKEIKPFIMTELSFEVLDGDNGDRICGGDRRYLIERDGYNYEISRHVLGQQNKELIEYRILRTIMPYKYVNNGYIFEDSITESCWVHLQRNNGSLNINCYEKIKHKTNCCDLCVLCDSKTKRCTSFSSKKHNNTTKHINNVIMYNDTIKETLEKKKIGDDMINEIMSYL
jgi:uncharacterized protein YllA (UPF0747 family)